MIKDVEPLLKECEETLKELMGMGNMEIACYVQGFINSINKLPSAEQRQHGEWIPCSERLPEKNGRYLASWVSNLTNKYNIDSIFFAYGEWDCCNGDVEAWKPLPEPYREEGEEK